MIFTLAVVAVAGNFFSFWAIPGLEGMTTFKEKQMVRRAKEAADNRAKGLDANGDPLPPES